MKEVIDLNGDKIEVPIDTPCHPGVNGGLPRPYDPIIDANICKEMEAKEIAYAVDAPQRELAKVIEHRKKEYGTVAQQLENIIENGLEVEQARVADIKIRHPKPVE